MLVPALTLLAQQPASAAEPRPAAPGATLDITLTLPHNLQPGDTAWLLVEVGSLGRDQVRLTTQDGQSLGTLSPSPGRPAVGSATYTIPVPPQAFHHRKLKLRFAILRSSGQQTPPTREEIKSVHLSVQRLPP